MARKDPNIIPYTEQDDLLEEFCDIVSKLKTKGAIFDFFKDLLNRQERLMLHRRISIAKMLMDDLTYNEIQEKLKVSPTTIARVDRVLNFGRGGYINAVKNYK